MINVYWAEIVIIKTSNTHTHTRTHTYTILVVARDKWEILMTFHCGLGSHSFSYFKFERCAFICALLRLLSLDTN